MFQGSKNLHSSVNLRFAQLPGNTSVFRHSSSKAIEQQEGNKIDTRQHDVPVQIFEVKLWILAFSQKFRLKSQYKCGQFAAYWKS